MATAAPTQNLPLFYRAIEPLNVTQHGKMRVRTVLNMGEIGRTHAIPLTVGSLKRSRVVTATAVFRDTSPT